MMAQLFNPKDPVSIIGLLATFTLTCDTNRIHEGAVMWVLPYIVHETLANVLSSRVYAEASLAPFAATVQNQKPRLRNLLRSYPEVVYYLL